MFSLKINLFDIKNHRLNEEFLIGNLISSKNQIQIRFTLINSITSLDQCGLTTFFDETQFVLREKCLKTKLKQRRSSSLKSLKIKLPIKHLKEISNLFPRSIKTTTIEDFHLSQPEIDEIVEEFGEIQCSSKQSISNEFLQFLQ